MATAISSGPRVRVRGSVRGGGGVCMWTGLELGWGVAGMCASVMACEGAAAEAEARVPGCGTCRRDGAWHRHRRRHRHHRRQGQGRVSSALVWSLARALGLWELEASPSPARSRSLQGGPGNKVAERGDGSRNSPRESRARALGMGGSRLFRICCSGVAIEDQIGIGHCSGFMRDAPVAHAARSSLDNVVCSDRREYSHHAEPTRHRLLWARGQMAYLT